MEGHNDFIDARSAREIADTYNIEKDKSRLEDIFRRIKKASEEGKYVIALINQPELTDVMKKYLQDRGFKIEYSNEEISGSWSSFTRITW